MIIFPAIDLIDGCAVRLYKGDYDKKTVYDNNPVSVALDFRDKGAEAIHIVDLDGAKAGKPCNLERVMEIKNSSGLFCEIGGGIRDLNTVEQYIEAGIDRVILGTAAITDERFTRRAVELYGEKIAVGVDMKDGYAAIRGWTEQSQLKAVDLCKHLADIGVKTIIATDISKDGAMQGTNLSFYQTLSKAVPVQITASGGVSSLQDVQNLKQLGLYAAIIGKAYYTGDIDLKQAVEVAQ
ncbi:MAG: 1-(5-phosphoribosyl)-5-[Clostridia bacterium]|nr:1-(5-phosphoribosyl)-5-[(5-phosphoribosylamino)methylideneamino]imidazole-4-carboxamide isomerase [Clostridia bacterium]